MKNHANMRTGVGSRPRADEIIIDGGADALLSARAAAARIGSRNPTQLTAMEKRDPTFPKAIRFGGHGPRMYRRASLDRWLSEQAAKG